MKNAYDIASAFCGGCAIGAMITGDPQHALAWALIAVLFKMHSNSEEK